MIILLLTVHLVTLSIWVGSLVALAIVAQTVKSVLDLETQSRFFPALGRTYAKVGTTALGVAIVTGAAAAGTPSEWSSAARGAIATALVLVIVSVVAMRTAHRTGLIRRAVAAGDGSQERALRSAVRATDAMRGAIAVLTLGMVVLEATAIAHR